MFTLIVILISIYRYVFFDWSIVLNQSVMLVFAAALELLIELTCFWWISDFKKSRGKK